LKLEKNGNTFTAFKSTDGVDWGTSIAIHTTAMTETILTGLCVSSNNNAKFNTAKFEDVLVSDVI
jgi:hypothetical protein